MHCFNLILLLFFTFFYLCVCDNDKFLYFSYGSNLTGKRLRLRNPSAEFYAVGVLKDHRLDFNQYTDFWNGAPATIVEDPEASVTGVVWTLDLQDMPHLDEQEGIYVSYYAKNVTITTLSGEQIQARTYVEINNPPKLKKGEDLPYERRPSNTYLEVLILGAVASGLPSDYIGYLVSFPTNGKNAPDDLRAKLGYPFGPAT